MSLTLYTGFRVLSGEPIDTRYTAIHYSDLAAILPGILYNGLSVYLTNSDGSDPTHANQTWQYQGTPPAGTWVNITTGPLAFLGLTDVPHSYAIGDANKLVKVKSTYDGLDFVSKTNLLSFQDLSDVAKPYGTAGQIVIINGSGTGLTYVNASTLVTTIPTWQQVMTAGNTSTRPAQLNINSGSYTYGMSISASGNLVNGITMSGTFNNVFGCAATATVNDVFNLNNFIVNGQILDYNKGAGAPVFSINGNGTLVHRAVDYTLLSGMSTVWLMNGTPSSSDEVKFGHSIYITTSGTSVSPGSIVGYYGAVTAACGATGADIYITGNDGPSDVVGYSSNLTKTSGALGTAGTIYGSKCVITLSISYPSIYGDYRTIQFNGGGAHVINGHYYLYYASYLNDIHNVSDVHGIVGGLYLSSYLGIDSIYPAVRAGSAVSIVGRWTEGIDFSVNPAILNNLIKSSYINLTNYTYAYDDTASASGFNEHIISINSKFSKTAKYGIYVQDRSRAPFLYANRDLSLFSPTPSAFDTTGNFILYNLKRVGDGALNPAFIVRNSGAVQIDCYNHDAQYALAAQNLDPNNLWGAAYFYAQPGVIGAVVEITNASSDVHSKSIFGSTGASTTWDINKEGQILMGIFNQTTQPTTSDIETNHICIWNNTSSSRSYLCFNKAGTIKSVELSV